MRSNDFLLLIVLSFVIIFMNNTVNAMNAMLPLLILLVGISLIFNILGVEGSKSIIIEDSKKEPESTDAFSKIKAEQLKSKQPGRWSRFFSLFGSGHNRKRREL